MRLPEIINASQMRSINRTAILEVIRQNSPIARSEIGRMLGLSLPTVMRIVDELFQENMVHYNEQEMNNIRRRELIEYHRDGHAVIGINLDGVNLYGALANIGGDIITEMTLEQYGAERDEGLNLLSNVIEKLLQYPRKEKQSILGISIGIPGITHVKKGIVEWAPSLKWRNLPLRDILEKRFNLPVIVDNDLNLSALGENWFGVGQGKHEMVLIGIGTGIGAGVILDGAVYRGAAESAGEVGYMIPDRAMLKNAYPEYGPLEGILSNANIAEQARQALAGKISAAESEALSARDVYLAAHNNEAWAIKITNEIADYLAIVIANITGLLNPELVVLGSGLADAADILIPAIQQRIKNVLPHAPYIEASSLGHRAVVMGAIAITVHRSSDYYVVKKLY
ncbi:MAG: ROK family transcriptional regulator [Anaerolineae bacterium]|nr:ROK family transcriptional regulator [Anaerolineae bacterium]